jgi:hypothetical protein
MPGLSDQALGSSRFTGKGETATAASIIFELLELFLLFSDLPCCGLQS